MIQTLSDKFKQPVAFISAMVFYLQFILPVYAAARSNYYRVCSINDKPVFANKREEVKSWKPVKHPQAEVATILNPGTHKQNKINPALSMSDKIGGPSQPEATSFKQAGADNLVNLFTGDFSYSIPLLDVDGYPVNLFYNGGITMEQEATWVGLGWNINPGSISRNMRGVPDDFDGTDTLIQTQNVKPNKTWGGEIGVDAELLGIKQPNLNFNVGFSYNNYLGPELDLGAGISVSVPLSKTVGYEKAAVLDSSQGLNMSLGLNAKLSSRSGLTLAPSLNAGLQLADRRSGLGVGLSTSYNSRTGIKDLTINSQTRIFQSQLESRPYLGLASEGFATDISNTNISFARPSYMPALRMPMQYESYAGQVELGAGMFGFRGSLSAQGYYSESKIADGGTKIYKPLFGYMYSEKANGHKDAVMDFNRLNDGEVTPNTPVISAPQYDYDVFTIQGEGTGGSIRAYRSDIGFMRDPEITSKDKSFSIGFDIAPAGHYGGNWNTVSTPTRSGSWDDINNRLNQTLLYKSSQSNKSFEHVYFRNPGEATVTNDDMINKMGRDNPVRFKIGGPSSSPWLESELEQFSKKGKGFIGTKPFTNPNDLNNQSRDKRTQVITMFTAADATKIGLDPLLHNYKAALDANNNLQYTSIARIGGYRKVNHISEITVLEGTGMRYVYGLPVYSITQRDYTFSTNATGNQQTNLLTFNQKDTLITSSNANIYGNTGIDGYVNIQETPAYASAFMLTGLLSADYVDITGNGISEDDLGTAVKFNYTMSPGTHKWRTPRSSTANSAYFNVGAKTEKRDNKATISYGEREAWYLHSIESKSMVAIFKISDRSDAKGVNNPGGAIYTTENANRKLDSIMLFSKADLKANGFAGALPLKTVHFEYSYALCTGTPDNNAGTGKLTLKDIYFTYNGQSRASKNMYVFNYGNTASNKDNPAYAASASDRWGTYKPVKDSANNSVNPNGLNNIDYPYTSTKKAADDDYAGAWSLKRILLPSGGQIEVTYEADDYAYVQNRRACDMFKIYGLGNSTDYTQNNMLYTIYGNTDQNYVYIQLPAALQNTDPVKIKQEIYAKYLDGMNQLAFKLNVNMPKGMEPLTVYADYDDYGLCTNSTDKKIIYVKLSTIDGKGPLANTAVHYLIDNLPGQAFPGYDLSDDTGIEAFLNLIASELSGLANAFKNAENQMRSDGKASSVSLANSFVRLADPDFIKYGGGHRVKRVVLKDNWNAISGQYTSQYGQDYDYTTTAMVNGAPISISSGVASYEPGIGSEENPFREILQFENKLPLASAQYGAIEMPVLEAFYPASVVGYSKVTVRSINRNGTHGDSVVRSAIGKQVTEFYTAKDYPVFATYTPMNSADYHHNPPFTFFNKETIDKRIISQGFLVETNDMHGKIKSQAAYSESDENTPLSYTLHTYKNTGVNGLNDLVDFVHNDQNGAVTNGNIGVDMELMTDVRQFNVRSNGFNGQAQVDFFTFAPFPVFGVFVYPLQSYTENDYKAVTTTKLINYHAIEDSIIVNDKGSTVTTKNILYDAETGSVVVNNTTNEYNQPIYTTSFPAYWAYSGMGPAYKNINIVDSNITFSNGRITTSGIDQSLFESGDELYVYDQSDPTSGCNATLTSPDVYRIWVYDTTKNTRSLTQTSRFLIFIDSVGRPFTKKGVNLRVIRSGKRNLLEAKAQQVVTMANPVRLSGSTLKLITDNSAQAVSASAMEYQEKWQVDKGVIGTFTTVTNGTTCTTTETPDCNGDHLEKTINPYRKGLLGTFRAYRNMVYYSDRAQTDPAVNTNIVTNGLLASFSPYWSFNSSSNLVPATTSAKWVWNTKSNRYNARGLELETQNALNVYSAAQYGYKNSLPVAVTNNAAYGESMFDGFEDYNYTASLNNAEGADCNNTRYADFFGLGSIFIPDSLGFYAHTGKYVLKVPKNITASESFSLLPDTSTAFILKLKSDTVKSLSDLGGNSQITFAKPSNALANCSFSFSQTSPSIYVDVNPTVDSISSNNRFHYYTASWNSYINVTTAKTYIFSLSLSTAYNNSGVTIESHSNGVGIQIYNLSGNTVGSYTLGQNGFEYTSGSYSIFLCPGIYKLSGDATELYSATNNGLNYSHNSYHWECTNSTSPLYKSLTTQNGCVYTVPIAATDSMLNPLFTPAPGKKMQFNAWVRQTTDNTGSAKIVFSDGTSVLLPKPNGISIEGWQKIEGDFTIPAGATSMTLQLANSDVNSPVYFDDIRIHPFNANMKSYVYDPRSLRLTAELDENNYASFYDYDEEGQLVRTKKETTQGIKTIQETRSAKQKAVKTIQ